MENYCKYHLGQRLQLLFLKYLSLGKITQIGFEISHFSTCLEYVVCHKSMLYIKNIRSSSKKINQMTYIFLTSDFQFYLFFPHVVLQYIHSAGIIHRVSSFIAIIKMNGVCPSMCHMCY